MGVVTYGSVCSGIEAASAAWGPLGMQPLWFSEIEKFASAFLAHKYPRVPNLGDLRLLPARIRAGEVPVPDILVGGTPCQGYSVAGKRKGNADPRSQLSINYVETLDALDEKSTNGTTCLWENVPGIFSDKNNAFGNFLAALCGEAFPLVPPGGRWRDAGHVLGPKRAIAWRVLDAQYFGLAQRRRRVFLVAGPRDGADPREVLFEFEGVRRDSAPRRQRGQTLARGTDAPTRSDGPLTARMHKGVNLRLDEGQSPVFGLTGDPTPKHGVQLMPTLRAEQGGEGRCVAYSFTSTGSGPPAVAREGIRKLTPVECERLMGFPDNETLIPYPRAGQLAKDNPRYKALGNSKAVPIVRWIGGRLVLQIFKSR